MSQCPCDNCQTRIFANKVFNFRFYGSNCPYDCIEYDLWSLQQINNGGKDDGMVLVGDHSDSVSGVRNKDNVRKTYE